MNIDRGGNGRNPRIRSLDTESHSDFVRGFRNFTFTDVDAVARRRAEALVADARLNDDSPEALRQLFEPDPLIATRLRCWISSQQLMWKGLIDHFEQHRDEYFADYAKSDAAGPGSLELNPDLDMPDYARHEIHLQPGGYVGHEFGGAVFHYGTDSFYGGHNDADEFHIGLVPGLTLPQDGKVDRIVDIGCGIGQLTVALKERFPRAEVWGLDVGGPLVRYAHHRAVGMGIDVTFAQRLAEDTGFADDSVDMVTAYILFHETPHDAAKAICAEALRILRPGGVFNVMDFHTGAEVKPDPYRKFNSWADHTYNCETWSQEFILSDHVKTMADVGFEAEAGDRKHMGVTSYIGRKPVMAS